ncbi:hypothetical protein AAHC03_01422 [Spirometra sp. Aus1]
MASATQSNGISEMHSNLEELKKALPHVDLETGLKNRVVKRDPITGLGELPKEHCDFGRPKSANTSRKKFNNVLLSWDADTAKPLPTEKTSGKEAKKASRNPITLTGDLGDEVDALRCTPRPRTATPREPQRDPISGQGNFGQREWDPIWKYNGKARRARSSTGDRCNPLTGENAKTFTISTEERSRGCMTPKAPRTNRNILTGQNCENYEVSVDFKSGGPKRRAEPERNAITGENCSTYDVNIENTRTGRARVRSATKSSNPVSGENVSSFAIMKEEKVRNSKPYVYSNAVTGENCQSYKINPIERNVSARPNASPSNPLLGENTQHYTYRVGEKQKLVKKRDLSSPLTGPGSRGNTYSVSVEERRRPSAGSIARNGVASGNGSSRNVLTGENCSTYTVCQEMRSERKASLPSNAALNGNKEHYNIITGMAG